VGKIDMSDFTAKEHKELKSIFDTYDNNNG
jgi:hypothetical protein